MEGEQSSSRGSHANGRGNRGAGRSRGKSKGGRNARGGFSGSLSNLPKAPGDHVGERSKAKDTGSSPDESGLRPGQGSHLSGVPTISDSAALSDDVDAAEAEQCFICAEPVQLYSISPCNHRTCHVCAVRLRALYKKRECTFCKVTSDVLIFSTDGQKDFLSFSSEDIPLKDDKLNIYFENAINREDTLILLRFNCPDPTCDYVASGWPDLRVHAKSEHDRFLCELCVKHSKIFVHEHKLYTSAELNRHIRAEHKYCDFCNINFYSSDELYIHMRDRHEQCFICKKDDERREEYQRDYKHLERHFKDEHYMCESKDCLEKKFVVFQSEMDFKAHQVAEHGAELSSREKRDALRVTANFRFDASSSTARAGNGAAGSAGLTARGKPKKEEEPETKRDVLGISSLAHRAHVPGAGGAANHVSRKAQFGAALTNGESSKGKSKGGVGAAEGVDEKLAMELKYKKHQRYMDQVYAILIHSDSKMQSFRANVKVYQAGETSSKDLVDSIYSLIGDFGQVETIIMGLVDLLEEADKKEDLIKSWNTLRIERTQFPSLAPTFLDSSLASTAAKGQIRNAKATSSASLNTKIWENVERAAASGKGYGGMAANKTSARDHFPSLGGGSKGTASSASIPGSVRHSAASNASMRGTPWAGSSANKAPHHVAVGSSTPSVKPYSVEVQRDPLRSNQTSIRSHPTSFPSLPSNSSAVNLAAYKRSLFENKQVPTSGDSTPNRAIWSASLGRIDGGDDVDVGMLREKLGEAQMDQQKKKAKQKNVVVSMGGLRRGG
ncbi:hypothetical protein CBS101457_006538 [Exobasidium rhododendri]|nr:hypothetical protein CBS101457_006538 [Exobasidium rhododendri]